MKTNLKVEDPEHILSNISEIIKDFWQFFVQIDEILYHFAKKPFV